MRDQSHSSRRQHSRNQALPFWPIYSSSSSVAPSVTRTISSSQKLELLAPTGHIGGQPALEALAQPCDRNWALALERQRVAAGEAELAHGHAGGARARPHPFRRARRDPAEIAAPVPAQPRSMSRRPRTV